MYSKFAYSNQERHGATLFRQFTHELSYVCPADSWQCLGCLQGHIDGSASPPGCTEGTQAAIRMSDHKRHKMYLK